MTELLPPSGRVFQDNGMAYSTQRQNPVGCGNQVSGA